MGFDKLVHQPTRLQIFAHLYANGETSFTDLTTALDVTEGNLASHIAKLEENECVAVEKRFVDRKPQTTYRLTEKGEDLFESHVRTLENLISDLDT
ncbi:winged helix-turn-helix domain-containing protein [Halosolutus gelatinilyticus]|uniref:winged helix-turn-helix domain-containing protein n=1 Tax=Halosolutus gelatinilyticus TaxID=2931975 RepID=UPI001FF40F9A|nr:transcriptional regulator [Halosolutus gelatinilyticus]